MSVSHSSMSRLHNVTPLLLSCLTNSTKTKLRINTLPPVCVCVCQRGRERKNNLMLQQHRIGSCWLNFQLSRPWKHYILFSSTYLIFTNREPSIFHKQIGCSSSKPEYNLSCFRRLKGLFGSIDQRQSRKAFIWKSIFNIFQSFHQHLTHRPISLLLFLMCAGLGPKWQQPCPHFLTRPLHGAEINTNSGGAQKKKLRK